MSAAPQILFYLGYDNDRGGICSFLRALSTAAAPRFEMTLGMNNCARFDRLALPVVEFPRIEGETISPRTIVRTRAIAREAREWLRADPRRIFHGCSRAGLLVALWLARWGERRVVATVHTYGRHRWFYRHAARQLGPRLFFLSPEMARYYGLPPKNWDDCLPPCIVGHLARKTNSSDCSKIQSGQDARVPRRMRGSIKILRCAQFTTLPEPVRGCWFRRRP